MIKPSDDHPYYLFKLSRDPFQTDKVLTDDYNHQFPPLTKVIEGNYFEIHKSNTDCDIYYLLIHNNNANHLFMCVPSAVIA